jgi:preprotein translocase subunit YajC
MLAQPTQQPTLMRYLVQLIIPILIFICVAWFAIRRRQKAHETTNDAGDPQDAGDSGMFIAILIIGAIAAVAIAWATQWLWDLS